MRVLPLIARRMLPALVLGTLAVVGCSDDRGLSTGPSDVTAGPAAAPSGAPEQLLGSLGTVSPFKDVPVAGTYNGGTFLGKYSVLKFVVDVDGKLKADVRLKGTVKTNLGVIVANVDVTVRVPVKVLESSCSILKLELGSIVKVLAGKNITLSKCLIGVDLTKVSATLAVSLKLLLCKVTGGLGSLTTLCGLLNQCLSLFSNCLAGLLCGIGL